jgi:hypothetical protein
LANFGQLLLLLFTYSIFIEIWRKQEEKYFNNFIESYESNDVRAEYRGPFIRSFVEDWPNTYTTRQGFRQTMKKIFAFVVMAALLVVCGIYFGLIRKVIVAEYSKFVIFYVFSTCHLLFYGVYFISILGIY